MVVVNDLGWVGVRGRQWVVVWVAGCWMGLGYRVKGEWVGEGWRGFGGVGVGVAVGDVMGRWRS